MHWVLSYIDCWVYYPSLFIIVSAITVTLYIITSFTADFHILLAEENITFFCIFSQFSLLICVFFPLFPFFPCLFLCYISLSTFPFHMIISLYITVNMIYFCIHTLSDSSPASLFLVSWKYTSSSYVITYHDCILFSWINLLGCRGNVWWGFVSRTSILLISYLLLFFLFP